MWYMFISQSRMDLMNTQFIYLMAMYIIKILYECACMLSRMFQVGISV